MKFLPYFSMQVLQEFGISKESITFEQRNLKKKTETPPMYQKFIITNEGVLRFGNVYQHCDLLKWNEECPYGGGLWKMDHGRGIVLLYGRSFAFGPPCFEQVKRIEWIGLGGSPHPLFHLPHWPSEETLIPVHAH